MGSSQSTPKITSHDKAVLDAERQAEAVPEKGKLRLIPTSGKYWQLNEARFIRQLQLSIDSEQQAAKQAIGNGEKSRALTALRQKKYHESLLLKTDDQLLSTIEFSQVQNKVLQSLSKGSEVLQELQKEMSLSKAENIMDRVGAGVAAQREIDDALMSKLSAEEEEAVEAELAALQQQALPSVPVSEQQEPVRLPDVPSHQPVDVHVDEEATAAAHAKQKQRENDLMMAMTA